MINIKDYPLLNGNNELGNTIREKILAEAKIVTLITEIQTSCSHNFENKMVQDKNFIYGKDHDFQVLDSKVCTQCGYTEKRPDGAPWVICHKCWGKMEHQGTTPQPDKWFIYKCSNPKCGYVVQHT